jgi:hypothetical protein
MEAALTCHAMNWGLDEPHMRSKPSEEHKMSAYANNRNSLPRSSSSHISHYTDRAIVVLTKTLDCYLAVRCELMTKMHCRLKLVLRF